ncbi:MAG TPA: GNAT family N-acetyltransferase [Ktedonobacteraceae bacterium]|nr:GNAT family N-acetyltransferase [Ktedonobacteraceae bacterium]
MILLQPMNETEYQEYLDVAIANYAQEHVRAGRWNAEDALQKATQEYADILTDGLHTKNQYLFTLVDEVDEQTATNVGMLWFAATERAGERGAFVYDVNIYEPFRRCGYGEQAFLAMETKARELGLKKIGLHVFGHNHAARAMYEKLDYVTTNVQMSKSLDTNLPLL